MSGGAVYAVVGYGAASAASAVGVALLRRRDRPSLAFLVAGACLLILGIATAVVLTTLLVVTPQ